MPQPAMPLQDQLRLLALWLCDLSAHCLPVHLGLEPRRRINAACYDPSVGAVMH